MRGKFKNVGTHIILIIASFISVFPLYWMIAAATNNSTDVLGGKLSLGTNFIQNLMKLTEMQNVSRAFCNSLFYSTILSVLSLFICSIAGYGFEIYHDKAKDTLMNILLLIKYLDRICPADDFHAVFDHVVPAECEIISDGNH